MSILIIIRRACYCACRVIYRGFADYGYVVMGLPNPRFFPPR
jgi:hypothetical protein